jgi:transcriptional regulator with PAS, ATPase and Fis domain
MEAHLGMICSNTKLAEKARKVAEERGIRIDIRIGTLEGAIPVVKEMEAGGIEVVICRNGTGAILKKEVSVPIISIPLSTFDLLEDVSEAAKYGKNVGISIYGHGLPGTEILENLLQIKILPIVYRDSETLRTGILDAARRGMDVYLGGPFASTVCREIGIPCVLFSSSEASIAGAMEEAKLVALIRREEMAKTRRVEAILSSVSEGMIAIDNRGIVTVFNRVAEEILEIRGAVGASIDSLLPQLGLRDVLAAGMPRPQCLQKIGEVQILANLMPVHLGETVIGAIASFMDVSKVMRAEQKVRRSYTKGFVAKYTLDDIVYRSSAMKRLIEQARRFARSGSTLLVTGESGTGKELVAHSIHNLSPRKDGPFVTVNCSALTENLLESELFGHEEGAFTGAKKGGKPGLFELAHKGTIFLDEVGSISEAVQSRLLRVLQQKEVMRIGGDRIIPVDVRIIAATNRDLLQTVKNGRFRLDLYFRLNILQIHLPPLRERKEDIPLLAASILEDYARQYDKRIGPLPGDLLKRFQDYAWPGNIRELQNFMEKFVLMADRVEQCEAVLDILFAECRKTERVLFGADEGPALLTEGDRKMLLDPVYKREEIARMMGISRTTLWRRLKGRPPAH